MDESCCSAMPPIRVRQISDWEGAWLSETLFSLRNRFVIEASPELALRRYQSLGRGRTRHVQQRSLLIGRRESECQGKFFLRRTGWSAYSWAGLVRASKAMSLPGCRTGRLLAATSAGYCDRKLVEQLDDLFCMVETEGILCANVRKSEKKALTLQSQELRMRWLLWLRGVDLNHRPLGYEPNELPDCSTPHFDNKGSLTSGQCGAGIFEAAKVRSGTRDHQQH